ncbi:hypothetical protein [Haloarcula montana]|uniref:hypothetical protein n=1 Tax=Haloarcula montana TaxID=3111776 RepID=UPI002D77C3A6|nr:hypothetical protein [Haloarcula sp. GH36]
MTDDGSESRQRAIGALARREYERAGDEYTRAAWQRLATPRDGQSPFEPDEKGWVGAGLQFLSIAGVAYRVAGQSGRATHRGVEGVAVANDLKRSLDEPVQRACLGEFAADFRAIGEMDGVADAYREARSAYERVGDSVDSPQVVGTTPLFEAAAAPLKQVARSLDDGEIAIAWEDIHGSDPAEAGAFLGHRADYKRRRFPSLLDRVVEAGYLAAPRGTTEYDNANHRCPACESTDINWAAGNTLCLRCSTPVERR